MILLVINYIWNSIVICNFYWVQIDIRKWYFKSPLRMLTNTKFYLQCSCLMKWFNHNNEIIILGIFLSHHRNVFIYNCTLNPFYSCLNVIIIFNHIFKMNKITFCHSNYFLCNFLWLAVLTSSFWLKQKRLIW